MSCCAEWRFFRRSTNCKFLSRISGSFTIALWGNIVHNAVIFLLTEGTVAFADLSAVHRVLAAKQFIQSVHRLQMIRTPYVIEQVWLLGMSETVCTGRTVMQIFRWRIRECQTPSKRQADKRTQQSCFRQMRRWQDQPPICLQYLDVSACRCFSPTNHSAAFCAWILGCQLVFRNAKNKSSLAFLKVVYSSGSKNFGFAVWPFLLAMYPYFGSWRKRFLTRAATNENRQKDKRISLFVCFCVSLLA